MWYHLRVSVKERPVCEGIIEYFLAAFPLEAYVFGYEEKDDNLHIHGHIKYIETFDPTQSKNKVKRSEFFKKMKKMDFVPDKNESNYHELARDEIKNMAYCMKDCDIIKEYNLPEDQKALALEYSEKIEIEKSTKMKDQLFNEWLPKKRNFTNKLEAYVFIDTYHVKRNYMPPCMTNKIQYALYIIYKLHELYNWDLNEESYKLIGSFQGIHEREAHDSYTQVNFIVSSYDEKLNPPSVNLL